jgi:hypothetical protein
MQASNGRVEKLESDTKTQLHQVISDVNNVKSEVDAYLCNNKKEIGELRMTVDELKLSLTNQLDGKNDCELQEARWNDIVKRHVDKNFERGYRKYSEGGAKPE